MVIVGLCASVPTFTDAAKPGGGTCTTMVLSNAYAPPKWLARCDPPAGPGADLKLTKFQLSFSFEPGRMTFDVPGSPAKFPFVFTSGPTATGSVVTAAGMTSNLGATSFKDVDIFELSFLPTSLNAILAVFSENFDGVIAPALPPGWTSTNFGAGTPWFTSMMAPNSPPNEAGAIANPNLGESVLLSPQFSVPASGARLTFKNRYDMEATHDGMVLEISINGGLPFADIITAGGTLVSGGYNGPITGANGSPIAGRNAWSGNSGGWINTAVNLPASANGQTVQLRWRLATDDSPGPGVGAQLDDISIDQPQPSFTVFANPMASDFLEAVDPLNPGTIIHFDAAQIAPTTRVFTPGVLPHIWDPNGLYDDGIIGGVGDWNTASNQWDDLPFPQPLSGSSSDTHWDNTTHANDFAVFGGDPGSGLGSGIVTVTGPISVGGFQFDISGYHIQGGNLVFPMSVPTFTTIETNANTATISSPISGGAFTKVGTGTLILAGNNSYTGTTTINAGTLLLNNTTGSGNGSSAVMVNSGGVLGGTGQIGGGPIGVLNGGALQGGDGTGPGGSLTIAANLTLGSGSIIKLALGPGSAHSTLNRVAGNWNFPANQGFTIINLGAQPGVVYQDIITGLDLMNPPVGVGSWHINNPGFAGASFVYDGAGNIDLAINNVPPPFTLLTVVSRKNHGAAGDFDIPLPPVSPFGVECRSGGASGRHKLVFTFSSPVSLGNATVTTGTGSVSFFYSSGTTITVYLTGVTNAQLITVSLSNVTDGASQSNFAVSAGILVGDVSGSGGVSSTDVSLVKTQAGAIVTNSNFRRDVVVNGSINGSDVSLVKLASGTALPPKPAR
jgi:autotransporter-associated beta strand protein